MRIVKNGGGWQMKLGDLLRSRSTSVEPAVPTSVSNESEVWSEKVVSVPIDSIDVNQFQPRSSFDEESLGELAASIREHGVLHPMIVRPSDNGRYELVAGERRLRACKLLGWEKVPVIVKRLDNRSAAELALIENLQREDLNCIEVAEGYRRLLDEFGLTQEELAERLGSSQSSVANKLRLLRLPEEVRTRISQEMIGERQARALLALKDEEQQLKVLERIVSEGLNVRQTEELVRKIVEADQAEKPRQRNVIRIHPDVRLLKNSVRKLVSDMQAGGSKVNLEEREVEDGIELVIRISTVSES